MKDFREAIIGWYKINKRDLPWRQTKDPYKIWLSEVILQQTQVAQGLSYYNAFTKKYPAVKYLAKASSEEIMKLWQGLGYYSRARNLHESAKQIMKVHKGIFPATYKDIRELKGVGDYTAAAIASICFGLPHAVVDGNVYRVLSRVFGIGTPIDSTAGKKQFQELANELLDKKDPATFNQAIMEFGARWCRPANPDCENCVLRSKCAALAGKKVTELPVKEKKQKIKKRFFHYLVFTKKGHTYIHKREEKDIWNGLYQFYLIETPKKIKPDAFLKNDRLKKTPPFTIKAISSEYKHLLSHQHLYTTFYHLELQSEIKDKLLKKVKLQDLNRFAFPRLIEKYLREFDFIK